MHYLKSPDRRAQKQSIVMAEVYGLDSGNRCLIQPRSKTKAVYWLKKWCFLSVVPVWVIRCDAVF